MNKTGTTALQSYFSQNRSTLLSHGVLYPKTGVVSNAHYELSNALGFKMNGENSISQNELSKLKNSLLKEITPSTSKVIISSEIFVRNAPLDLVKEFFSDFNIKIVVYLRRHDHWYLSAYAQSAKMKSMPPWRKGPLGFIKFSKKNNPKYINYRHLVDRWANAFGKENIIVRPYEKEQNQPNLATDFFGAIGCKELINNLPKMVNIENESLSIKSIQYMDIFQRVKTDNKTRTLLLEYTKSLGINDGHKVSDFLNPESKIRLIKENEVDYDYIAREYLERDNGQLFYEALPEVQENWKSIKWPSQEEVAEVVLKALGKA